MHQGFALSGRLSALRNMSAPDEEGFIKPKSLFTVEVVERWAIEAAGCSKLTMDMGIVVDFLHATRENLEGHGILEIFDTSLPSGETCQREDARCLTVLKPFLHSGVDERKPSEQESEAQLSAQRNCVPRFLEAMLGAM